MTLDDWLRAAVEDAKRRNLPELEALLNGLRGATATLRAADFRDDASGAPRGEPVREPGART